MVQSKSEQGSVSLIAKDYHNCDPTVWNGQACSSRRRLLLRSQLQLNILH